MNVQLNSVSDTRKSLVVTFEPKEIDAEHQEVVGEFTKMVRLPGFRPGRAPAAMVVKRYSKEIAEQFKQQVVAKAYRGAMEEKKLEVLNVVDVKEGAIEPGTAAEITVTVDVRPEFTLPDYSNLPTEVEPVDPTDAEVDNVLQALRNERADFKTASRPAQKGDYVKLAYSGTVDGKPIAELAPDKQIYAQVPQTWEEVEGAQEGIIPGLGAQLAGLAAGGKKDVAITFPAEFPPVPALAGKKAVYAVEVLEVRERILPELNEEFFKSQQVDSLDALKTRIRDNLKQQKDYQNRAAQRRQVTEALSAKVEFPIPESLIESETQSVLRQFMEENLRRGVPAEQFEKDKQALYAGARTTAAQRVKARLILAKVAEAEKIEVASQDLDEFIYREAMRTRQQPDKLARELSKDRDMLRSVQQSIIFDKAVDFLVSKATIKTVSAKAS
ncbi:MAG TPA: trigger factor [Opitutaceae bacterium]|nr:trigger factor [Opitutaceae bacterium]